MSIHPSLRGVNTLVGERSVFTRVERLQILAKKGEHDLETHSVLGLRKVRTRFKALGAKKKKAEKDEDKPAEGAK
jgi:small basic protein (TIGR04137 family)